MCCISKIVSMYHFYTCDEHFLRSCGCHVTIMCQWGGACCWASPCETSREGCHRNRVPDAGTRRLRSPQMQRRHRYSVHDHTPLCPREREERSFRNQSRTHTPGTARSWAVARQPPGCRGYRGPRPDDMPVPFSEAPPPGRGCIVSVALATPGCGKRVSPDPRMTVSDCTAGLSRLTMTVPVKSQIDPFVDWSPMVEWPWAELVGPVCPTC